MNEIGEPNRVPADGDPSTRLVVSASDQGARADQLLARVQPNLSRRVIRELARRGLLSCDGRPCAAGTRPPEGSLLELRVPPPRVSPSPAAGDGGPVILAQTPRFLYVDKPAGIHVTRVRPDDPPCLADWVAERHPECREAAPDPREGGAVHRLDGETTGVVAFARDEEAWRLARAAFTRGEVRKLYIAASTGPGPWPPPPEVWGAFVRPSNEALDEAPYGLRPDGPSCDVTIPIAKGSKGLQTASPNGRPARSLVWRLHDPETPAPELRLFAIDLRTGVRHQIRVHLAALGVPIQGDRRYGDAREETTLGPVLALHAAVLDLSRVFPDEPRGVLAPQPVWLHRGRSVP